MTQASATERVWAGGDAASLARFVTEAIGMGKRAALDIHAALAGEAASAADEGGWRCRWPRSPPGTTSRPRARTRRSFRPTSGCAAAPRCNSASRSSRRWPKRALLPLRHLHHLRQLRRRLPDLAVRRVGDGYEVLAEYCKGCGLCVRECPTGSMTMIEERR
ncbi:MAG: 4Fe-4S binding protein [Ideonella sp.]|nr:4Fe-4S binding protein [Ideonella sp.]